MLGLILFPLSPFFVYKDIIYVYNLHIFLTEKKSNIPSMARYVCFNSEKNSDYLKSCKSFINKPLVTYTL